MSKVLILVGSPRKSGNTELLANAFAEGAASAHHEVFLGQISENVTLKKNFSQFGDKNYIQIKLKSVNIIYLC